MTSIYFLAALAGLGFIYFVAAFIVGENAHYPNFQVSSASIYSLTINNATKLTAELNITLSVSNPNHYLRISYHHHEFHVKVFYTDKEHVILDNTSTLQQSNFNGSSLIHMILKVDTYSGSYVADGIDLSRRKHGMVEFGLTMLTSIMFKNKLFFLYSWETVKVVCNPIRFAISPNVYNTTPGILLQPLTCTCGPPQISISIN
ncbi:hypothetical protein MtrunA17_Chr5g0444471 [Medicago truncatula]|uniref:Transmembrane protein, putative n=1 Tax=Medicago truncatula TaxID=3880 RepID=G7K3K3_MEDTR|nr:transmembrane protein, putative [Medicago truncatula]RHN57812.1 hypothetical protein MtrunA17_Chr5g0444471 [Medicago truncatula]